MRLRVRVRVRVRVCVRVCVCGVGEASILQNSLAVCHSFWLLLARTDARVRGIYVMSKFKPPQ